MDGHFAKPLFDASKKGSIMHGNPSVHINTAAEISLSYAGTHNVLPQDHPWGERQGFLFPPTIEGVTQESISDVLSLTCNGELIEHPDCGAHWCALETAFCPPISLESYCGRCGSEAEGEWQSRLCRCEHQVVQAESHCCCTCAFFSCTISAKGLQLLLTGDGRAGCGTCYFVVFAEPYHENNVFTSLCARHCNLLVLHCAANLLCFL